MNFAKSALVIAVAVVLLGMVWAAQQNYRPALTGHCSYTDQQRGLVFFHSINDATPDGGTFVVTGGADDTCLVNGVTDMPDRSWIFSNGWSADIAGATVKTADTMLPTDSYTWQDGYLVTKSTAGRVLRSVSALHTMLISFAFMLLAYRAFRGT